MNRLLAKTALLASATVTRGLSRATAASSALTLRLADSVTGVGPAPEPDVAEIWRDEFDEEVGEQYAHSETWGI